MQKKYFILLISLLIFIQTVKSQIIISEKTRPGSYSIKRNKKDEAVLANTELSTSPTHIWAVLVGISNYKDTQYNLQYAAADAKLYYDFLKSPSGGLVPEHHISLLMNEKATQANILGALEDKFNQAATNDLVIFFIASHGVMATSGQLYFLNYEADANNLRGTAVRVSEIDEIFKSTQATKQLFIADACHSGGTGFSFGKRNVENSNVNRLLHQIANSESGVVALMASRESESSLEDAKWGNGHGVFTYYLIDGLKGNADFNKNGLVTLGELYDYLYEHIPKATQNKQHPSLNGNLSNTFPLSVISNKK
jgi:uncharacterized caspase-like protein